MRDDVKIMIWPFWVCIYELVLHLWVGIYVDLRFRVYVIVDHDGSAVLSCILPIDKRFNSK